MKANLFSRSCLRLLVGGLLLSAARISSTDGAPFIHPGLLDSREDLARIKVAVEAKTEPIYSGYGVFSRHVESQANYVLKGPKEGVGRGTGWNGPTIQNTYDPDANAAYQCAIMWTITGDKAYADKSKQILNAWSSTLKVIGGRDQVLGAGLGPFKMINAAEIIRYTNAGWSDADIKQTEKCFKEVVYPVVKDFSPFANGNWDTAAVKTVMAIGVFCNDRDIYERGLRYYVNGQGDGRLTHYIINDAGQCQESGRDSQHSQLGIAHLGDASQCAWNQGLNLYGYADNRLLKGVEYAANHNLGGQVPYLDSMDRTGDAHNGGEAVWRTIAPAGDLRNIYEEFFNHYVNMMGLSAPYTQKAIARVRPEGQGVAGNAGINGADHIGFGTLLFGRTKTTEPPKSPLGMPQAPGAIVAQGSAEGIKLTWIESIGATTYTVKRSSTHGGPYTALAKDVKTSAYTDRTVQPGKVYYYVATATNAQGESADAYETGSSAGLPTPWKQQDIGKVVVAGGTQFDGRMFTVEGGGSAIGGTGDQMQFAYMPRQGDGSITVRYVPQVSSQHLQFGIMMRESVNPDAAEVAYLIQRGGSVGGGWSTVMMARPTTGAAAMDVSQANLGAPTVSEGRLMDACWLRLARMGNTFTASFSLDGKQWTPGGMTTVALKSGLLAGVGACSRLISPTASATTTVIVDQVAVTGWTNPAEAK